MPAGGAAPKILIVDDEPQVLTAVGQLLEGDFQVLATTDPEKGLLLLKEEEVAVVLADQRMPRTSGDQFLRQARQVSGATRVLFTGYTDLEDLVQAINQGHIYAYVTKPWGPVELKSTIHQASENYRLERALRESEARLRFLVEHLPEGVLLLDAEQRVVLANPAAEAYLKILSGIRPGEKLTRLGEQPLEEVLQALAPAESAPRELRLAGPKIFELRGAAIGREQAENEWVLVVVEVTRERQVQRRIQQQERLAAVGQLAAGMAHDFNNLLMIMVVEAQLLARAPDLAAEHKERLRHLVAQGEQGAQLIRRMLDFSGSSRVNFQVIDLAAFVRWNARFLRRTLSEAVRVVDEAQVEGCAVRADPTLLQQALTNLALNARDAMPQGGTLRLGVERFELRAGHPSPVPGLSPGAWVVLAVADEGVGIAEKDLESIFEPFFTTKEPGKGSGLGLAQVYGIVKQHQGEIAVESQIGKGTTFRIYLPLAQGAPSAPALAEEEPAAELDCPSGRGETILLVEDQQAVREAVQRILTHLNYRVLTAGNGLEALQVYEYFKEEIDLVLTDIVMPEMGGKELSQVLKSRDPRMPIVAMSGYVPAGGEDQLPRDLAGFLPKPVAMNQLARLLAQLLVAATSSGEREGAP
jgi:signal transduction histidine kinase